MSLLSEKYKVPEPTIKNMIRDGVIPCSWETYEEVIERHKQGKSTGEIADELRISIRYVQKIIQRTK